MKRVDDDVPNCVKSETAFTAEIRKWVAKETDCQFEIGRLVHYYIREYGKKNGVYEHIADLAQRSERSIRNYHAYYRIETEYDSANLQNLPRSARYQLARLLHSHGVSKKVDASKLIPELADRAIERELTVNEVGKYVTEALRNGKLADDVEKEIAKDKPDSPDPDAPIIYSDHEDSLLNQATEMLELLSRYDIKFDYKIGLARRRATITSLSTQLLSCLHKMTAEDDANNMRAIIKGISCRVNEISDLIEKRAQSERKVTQ